MTDDTPESTDIVSGSSGDFRVDKAPGFEGNDTENDTDHCWCWFMSCHASSKSVRNLCSSQGEVTFHSLNEAAGLIV